MRKQPIREAIRATASTITTSMGVVSNVAKYADIMLEKEVKLLKLETSIELLEAVNSAYEQLTKLGVSDEDIKAIVEGL